MSANSNTATHTLTIHNVKVRQALIEDNYFRRTVRSKLVEIGLSICMQVFCCGEKIGRLWDIPDSNLGTLKHNYEAVLMSHLSQYVVAQ